MGCMANWLWKQVARVIKMVFSNSPLTGSHHMQSCGHSSSVFFLGDTSKDDSFLFKKQQNTTKENQVTRKLDQTCQNDLSR